MKSLLSQSLYQVSVKVFHNRSDGGWWWLAAAVETQAALQGLLQQLAASARFIKQNAPDWGIAAFFVASLGVDF